MAFAHEYMNMEKDDKYYTILAEANKTLSDR